MRMRLLIVSIFVVGILVLVFGIRLDFSRDRIATIESVPMEISRQVQSKQLDEQNLQERIADDEGSHRQNSPSSVVVLDELSLIKSDQEFRLLIQQANASLLDSEARKFYSRQVAERSVEYKKQVLVAVKSKLSESDLANE